MPDKPKAAAKSRRLRPQFEIDPVMHQALLLYMKDEEVRQQSSVMRKALKQFLPEKYMESARRLLARGRKAVAA